VNANGGNPRIVIQGGTVVTAEGSHQADLLCEGEQITAIGRDLVYHTGDRFLDADGLLVLPGGIDAHTHFDEPFMGTIAADDFMNGGLGAICGGITSHIDFAYQFKGETLRQALQNWHRRADGKAVIDYGFHVVITDPTDEVKREIPGIVEAGYPTFKVFMTYPNLVVNDGDLLDLLQIVTRAGGRVSVHAENFHMSQHLVEEFHRHGKFEPKWHPHSRPWQSEYEATVRAMALAQVAQASLYVVHLSTDAAVTAVTRARSAGQPVIAETCIHYLVLTDEVYQGPSTEAMKYVCSPPIRPRVDRDALWAHLAAGEIQVIGSDHDPFTLSDRQRLGGRDFAKIPNGIAGIEQIRPFLWSEGVRKDRLRMEQFVALTATNPARAFGLWPRKGTIAVGSDADIVLWDPEREVRIGVETTHSASDYCPYEGHWVTGYPVTTISRGEILWHNGQLSAAAGRGSALKRGTLFHL
jgi:dihydropyrimidinase